MHTYRIFNIICFLRIYKYSIFTRDRSDYNIDNNITMILCLNSTRSYYISYTSSSSVVGDLRNAYTSYYCWRLQRKQCLGRVIL